MKRIGSANRRPETFPRESFRTPRLWERTLRRYSSWRVGARSPQMQTGVSPGAPILQPILQNRQDNVALIKESPPCVNVIKNRFLRICRNHAPSMRSRTFRVLISWQTMRKSLRGLMYRGYFTYLPVISLDRILLSILCHSMQSVYLDGVSL